MRAVAGDHEFSIQSAPPTGTFFHEPFFDWPMWGQVRPEADVTVNGLETRRVPLDQMHPGSDPDAWWWNSYAPNGGGISVPLSVGSNIITFRAEFTDETETVIERVVEHDPTLQRMTGYITGLGSTSSVTLTLVDLEYGEFGVEPDGDSEVVETEVADGAIFIFLAGDRPSETNEFFRSFDLPGFVELFELVDQASR